MVNRRSNRRRTASLCVCGAFICFKTHDRLFLTKGELLECKPFTSRRKVFELTPDGRIVNTKRRGKWHRNKLSDDPGFGFVQQSTSTLTPIATSTPSSLTPVSIPSTPSTPSPISIPSSLTPVSIQSTLSPISISSTPTPQPTTPLKDQTDPCLPMETDACIFTQEVKFEEIGNCHQCQE